VPLPKQAVVPFAEIVDLRPSKKGGAFLDQSLDRFGDEKFQNCLAVVAVADSQLVFAQPREPDLIQLVRAIDAEILNACLRWKLRVNAVDCLRCPHRNLSE